MELQAKKSKKKREVFYTIALKENMGYLFSMIWLAKKAYDFLTTHLDLFWKNS